MAACRAGALVILLALAGCCRVPQTQDLPLNGVLRGLALDGVKRFGEALNRGACQSIYDDASVVLQGLEASAAWRHECERMRETLGSWESFRLRAVVATGPSTVLVDGTAVFAKGPCHMGTTWNVENGRARLFSLYLLGPAGVTTIPAPWPGRRPRLIDPPLRRPAVAA